MKKLSKISALFLALLVSISVLATPAYADSPDWLNGLKEGASNLWDKAKDKGSEIIDTVKTEGPGWVETGKEKVGEAVDKAGEAVQEFKDWNAEQPQQFWDRTERLINGGSTATPAPAQANPNGTTNSADANVQATIDPDFVNRSEKIVSEWTSTDPVLDPTPNLDFVNQSDEFADELHEAHAGEYGSDEQSAGTSIDDEVEQIRNEILPSANPEIPENILSAIPIAGDVAALASALPEQNPQITDDAHSDPEPSELAGTLFYRGEWYRETKGDADVVCDGRAFARTDEVYLNLTTELDDDAIVLDGSIIQLSRTDCSVQEVSPTQPERRLTDGDMWKSIATATIIVVVACGLGALALSWQSRRRVKDQ